MMEGFQPWLMVSQYIATRTGDVERGPLVRLHPTDARRRLLEDGELVWVYGPRRHELAVLVVDDTVNPGNVVARDIRVETGLQLFPLMPGRLGVPEGGQVRITSAAGSIDLPVRDDPDAESGSAFIAICRNRGLGSHRGSHAPIVRRRCRVRTKLRRRTLARPTA